MSNMNAIKTFRDLLAFLTIIPLGKTEDFVVTSAEYVYLFPLIGGLIGLFAAGYFLAASFIVANVMILVNYLIQFPAELIVRAAPAVMTLAFLLVLTGLQHFDGLVDLGNAIGLGKLEERREMAHAWVVTSKGALLAIAVELVAFLGLFFLTGEFALRAIIASEISAKLAMVTITWAGKPTHKGLGSSFLTKAKRKRSIIAYVVSGLIVYLLLGVVGLLIVPISFLSGVLMGRVAERVFGGVSGDMIGATNEVARAATLAFAAGVLVL